MRQAPALQDPCDEAIGCGRGIRRTHAGSHQVAGGRVLCAEGDADNTTRGVPHKAPYGMHNHNHAQAVSVCGYISHTTGTTRPQSSLVGRWRQSSVHTLLPRTRTRAGALGRPLIVSDTTIPRPDVNSARLHVRKSVWLSHRVKHGGGVATFRQVHNTVRACGRGVLIWRQLLSKITIVMRHFDCSAWLPPALLEEVDGVSALGLGRLASGAARWCCATAWCWQRHRRGSDRISPTRC